MEIIPKGRHFRLLQDSELPEIMDYLEKFLPEALKFHQTIKTYLNDRIWQFYFYVSYDWPEQPVCLHFPGCTLTPHDNIYESIGIFCPTSHIECLDILENENILIDWSKPMYMNYTHKDIIDRIDCFYSVKGTMERLKGDIYVYKKLNDNLVLDELSCDVEMRQLTGDNMKTIHDLYPASEIECIEVFEKLVEILPGIGIFLKSNDELAAWMVHSYYGAMFSMQTKPEFRRKGYGIHLARNLTKLVIERGYLPYVVIRPENDASRSLYMKLGFQKEYETVRVKLRPYDNGISKISSNIQDDEGIEDMLGDKCEINSEKGKSEKVKDEGIDEEDKI